MASSLIFWIFLFLFAVVMHYIDNQKIGYAIIILVSAFLILCACDIWSVCFSPSQTHDLDLVSNQCICHEQDIIASILS